MADTISDKITRLNEVKQSIKQSIIDKGVAVADTDPFSAYAGKIGQISGGGGGGASTEWQPDPLWPDIEKLLIEKWPSKISKETGYGCAVLLYGFSDTATLKVNGGSSTPSRAILSDGTEYGSSTAYNTVHTWDKTKDIYGSDGLPVRYMLFYDSARSGYGIGFYESDWFDDPVVCIYFKGEFQYNGNQAFYGHTLLRSIKIDGKLTCASSSQLLQGAQFITKVPDNIYTTGTYTVDNAPFSGTSITEIPIDRFTVNWSQVSDVSGWKFPRIVVMPEFFVKSKPRSMWAFGGTSSGSDNFGVLVRIPDGWDLSSCEDFSRCGNYLAELRYAGTVDMSANVASFTNSTRGAFNCSKLIDIKCTLPSNTNVWFNASTTINIESFRFMADHAPDVTATPRTLTVGSTNISRINEADPTIITDLNARGWTVA